MEVNLTQEEISLQVDAAQQNILIEVTKGASTGSVTSVAAVGEDGVEVSGSPITTTGVLTIKLSSAVLAQLAKADSALQNITSLLQEGDNITITGTGTSGDPYVIGIELSASRFLARGSSGATEEKVITDQWISSLGIPDVFFDQLGVARRLTIGTTGMGQSSIVRMIRGDFMGSLFPTVLTTNKSWTLPDATGTIALTSNLTSLASLASNTFTGTQTLPKTVTPSGTTGAQVINTQTGSVNFAAGASSLVVTSSIVTANSIILTTIGSDDDNMYSAQAVAAAGSFTLYPNSPPAAETRVNFIVFP